MASNSEHLSTAPGNILFEQCLFHTILSPRGNQIMHRLKLLTLSSWSLKVSFTFPIPLLSRCYLCLWVYLPSAFFSVYQLCLNCYKSSSLIYYIHFKHIKWVILGQLFSIPEAFEVVSFCVVSGKFHLWHLSLRVLWMLPDSLGKLSVQKFSQAELKRVPQERISPCSSETPIWTILN